MYNVVDCDNRFSHIPAYLLNNTFVFPGKTEQSREKGLYVRGFHGPALCISHTLELLSTDSVGCVRCLVWPPQAADWPTRHRNYGWPDSATLDRVVSDGCDVVGVAQGLK